MRGSRHGNCSPGGRLTLRWPPVPHPAIPSVAFPISLMLLDRRPTLSAAIATSLQVVARNPAMAAAWGLIVAVALALASIPAFLGLVIVLPWLGHASWHLYRKSVRWPPP